MARILVVEDDATVRNLVMRLLTVSGHQAYEAENGSVALDVIEDVEIDLILSDLCMPVMDGVHLLSSLRAQGDQTPFVAMSGQSWDASRFATFSVDDFIAKPFMLKDLVDVLDRTLAGKATA